MLSPVVGTIEVDLAAVRGEPGEWLFVEAGGYGGELRERVREAATAASWAADEAAQDEPPGVVVAELAATPSGVAVVVDECASAEALVAWARLLARELAERGVSATLRAAPRPGVRLPYPGSDRGCVTLGLSLTLDGAGGVPREAVAAVAGFALEWLPRPARELSALGHGGQFRATSDQVLHELARYRDGAGPWPTRDDGYRAAGLTWWRQLRIDRAGRVLLETRDVQAGWADLADRFVAALLRLAPFCDLGFVRRSRTPSDGWWQALGRPLPRYPDEAAAFVDDTRPLDLDRLPALFGVTAVRDAHLARAGDLGPDWDVEDVGAGRHLVTAGDLEPWFATAVPPWRVRSDAAAAFLRVLASETDYGNAVRPRPVPGWVAATRGGAR